MSELSLGNENKANYWQERSERAERQLAKANERVAILEKERDHAQRMYNSLLGDLSAGYGALSIPECESQLNKFAIEQQIKALEWFDENNLMEDETTTLLLERIEQLRKEQE